MEPISALLESPLFSKLLVGIGAICVLILFWWRAGSISSVLEHVWRLMAGKAEASNLALKQFIHETRDVERFQFVYGLKLETIHDLERLLAWMGRHRIGIGLVQRAGRWIDIRSVSVVSRPSTLYGALVIVTLIFSYLLTMASFAGAFSSSTLLYVKGSSAAFLTDAKVAEPSPLSFAKWKIEASTCMAAKADILQITGFSEHDVNSICEALTTENRALEATVKATLPVQRWMGGILGSIALIWFISAIRTSASIGAAKLLIKRTTEVPEENSREQSGKSELEPSAPRIRKTKKPRDTAQNSLAASPREHPAAATK